MRASASWREISPTRRPRVDCPPCAWRKSQVYDNNLIARWNWYFLSLQSVKVKVHQERRQINDALKMTVSVTRYSDSIVWRRPPRASSPQWQRFQTALIPPSNQAGSADRKTEVHPYQRQYSHVYHQRLVQLAPHCQNAFKEVCKQGDMGEVKEVERLLELNDEVRSFVVGTLVKEPSPNSKTPGEPLVKGTECRASDVLYLEDESGRVALQFSKSSKEDTHSYCTGVVVGVLGQVSRGGVLLVERVILPSLRPPDLLVSPPQTNQDERPSFLLLVSGLQFGTSSQPDLKRDMLLNFLEGRLSHHAARHVSGMVICGGLIAQNENNDPSSKTNALLDLDAFLFQATAGAGVAVDMLPGDHDPTTANWPQRPIHSSLILQSTNFGMVNRSPNPYDSSHQSCQVIATDGLNVRDMQKHILMRHQDHENDERYAQLTELELLRRHLEFAHICPTGPASVPTVPHALSDPMVLMKCPHVFVAGNCSVFETQKVQVGSSNQFCRLVCLPMFSDSGEAVLLNLQTRDVELLRFEG